MRNSFPRVLISGITLAIFLTTSSLIASANPVDPQDSNEVPPSMGVALKQANQLGESVEVVSLTMEHSRVLANADGTFTMQSSRQAARVHDGNEWRPIDTTIIRSEDGRYRATATALSATFSAGGIDYLANLTSESGSVTISLDFELPEPRRSLDPKCWERGNIRMFS